MQMYIMGVLQISSQNFEQFLCKCIDRPTFMITIGVNPGGSWGCRGGVVGVVKHYYIAANHKFVWINGKFKVNN